jgi:hypothetical protein
MFGDALLRAHRSLLKDLRKVRDAAQATSPEGPAGLADLLEATRADILKHFRFEEQNGYMASVLEAQPHLERAARHLQEEHGQLLRSLDELIGATRSAAALTDDLREKVANWAQSVQRHERSENALVQDAFNLDLAAED